MSLTSIFQVLENGDHRRIGAWNAEQRRLELEGAGYPLLGLGHHMVEGELPWLFWDMCPSGFLGRRFVKMQPGLSLGSDPRTWTTSDALRILSQAGEDLSGNLLIGERSLERWRRERGNPATPRPWEAPGVFDAWLAAETPSANGASSSSLGGERPKLSWNTAGGGVLVKFSPPMSPHGTPQARRWADLLRVEAHCAATLTHFGVPAVRCAVANSVTGRVLLEVERFDRLPNWGRRGAATLYWYAMERYGDVRVPAPEVIRGLVDGGHLPPETHGIVERVHAFSYSLGNNDTHLGNYGLLFDEAGRASLAPFYDILPMALAPVNDELPDERLRPLERRDEPAEVTQWLTELIRRVDGDADISDGFRETWHRHLAR